MESGDSEYLFVDLHTPEIDEALEGAKVFRKNVRVRARELDGTELVRTTLSDGTLESEHTPPKGGWLITNATGEEYAIRPKEFHDRHDATDEPGVYQAKGMIRAARDPFMRPIKIFAHWGAPHFGNARCWISETIPTDGSEPRRSLIGDYELGQTYVQIPPRGLDSVPAAPPGAKTRRSQPR